jgi:hypothetical protein
MRLRADQRGTTLIEGLIAALLLTAGALGALQVFDAATRNNFRAEQSQVVVNRLQAELERIQALPYAQIAMTDSPGTSSDPLDPRSMVSGPNLSIGGPPRTMVINGGPLDGGGTITEGTLDSGPTPFESGDVSGEVYRFVAWLPDPSCSQCSSRSVKRVVVAASIDDAPSSFPRAYQTLHTDIADPDTEAIDNPAPPGDDGDAVAEFWLTDTTCNHSVRQEITADHATHNTRGNCSNGLQTGSTAGAPDLMFNEAPALDPDFPPAAQPMFDYATDVEPAQNPSQDKGLTLERPSINGCLLTGTLLDLPLLEPNKHRRIHKWLSPPIPDGLNVLMLGRGTLSLWTKTVNGGSHAGRICVYLFMREINLLGLPVDTPIVNLDDPLQVGYFTYTQNPWPTQWTEIAVPMHFANTGLLPGRRLGVAITVERAGTPSPAQGLEFMYDHPSFESRLQVDTNTLIGF